MAKLTGQTIAASYDQLLIVGDADGISSSLQAVESADTGGSSSALKIATNKIEIIPGSDDANAFEVSQADGTAVLTVNTSTVGATLIGPLTVGVDDAGHDVIFYGNTASSNMTWDTSADDLILNDATLKIDQDDNVQAIYIDSESTTTNVIQIDAPTTTTANCLAIESADGLTTGSVARFTSNSSTTNTRDLVRIINDHTSATGATALKIQQDAAQYGMFVDQNGNAQAIQIDAENTTTAVLQIEADALTTGNIANFYSNTSDDTGRNLVSITNEDAGATGTVALHIKQDSTNAAISTNGGGLFLNESANANQSLGITVNQGGHDDEIFALKSSDVNHGMSTDAEVDTFFTLAKHSGAEGGVKQTGFSEATVCHNIIGKGTTDNTAKSTSARGCIELTSTKKTGTSQGAPGSDSNIVVITANNTARFIFDAEGSGHADVEWTTFSDERLKKNVEDIPYGLNELNKLEPKIYDRYSGHIEDGKVKLEENPFKQIGFIAQEVKKIIPELVKDVDESESFYSLDDGKMVSILVKSIQELSQQVEDLKKQVNK